MEKFYKEALVLFLYLTLSGIGIAQVTNGSFENWTGNTPDGWSTIDAGITLIQTNSIVKSGSLSASVTVTTTTQSNTDLRQTVNVTPGQSYNFSVWVYHTEGGVSARLYVDGYQSYSDPSITGVWQQISFAISPATSDIEVGLRFYDGSEFDGSETVYVDDFQPASAGSGGETTCTDTEGRLSLTTDSYGSETSWEITSEGSVVYSGSSYSDDTSYNEDFCLADGNYTFTIYDTYGDGICCSYGNGSYALIIGGITIASGDSFGSSESVSFTVGSSSGGSGSGYYAAVDGLSGYALKTGLHNIINGHTPQGYDALWTFYSANELDNYYENDGTLLDIYSENPSGTDSYNYTAGSDQCGTYSTEGDCYNREHSFPRSWFGGEIEPMNSDVHHIFASDGYVNGRRSSYPYGEVGSATFTSSNGSKLGSGSGIGYTGTVFEPIDEFKGDLARAYFYMATRYEDVISGWETNTSYTDAVLDGTSDHVFEDWALTMLIDWHTNDPVSAKEIVRNEAAFVFQGNRNPFVDHPEYVNLIWSGGSSRTVADHTVLVKTTPQIKIADIRYILTNEHLQITFEGNPVQIVQVMDVTGKLIHQANVRGLDSYIFKYHFASQNIYLIRLQTTKDNITRKLMIR